MSRVRAIVILAVLAVVATPMAVGASALDRNLTGNAHPTCAAHRALDTQAAGDNVPLDGAVTFTDKVALAADAAVQNGRLPFEIYLERAGGSLTIDHGYVTSACEFVRIAGTAALPVERHTRVHGDPVTIGATKTVVDVGLVQGELAGVDGILPNGAFPALRLTFTPSQLVTTNSVYTQPSFLGAPEGSSATVPLPELSTLALFALGGALVAGVVVYRRK